MANYYHEARAQVRRNKEICEENKRRAERKAEYVGGQAEHPINFLMVEGHGMTLHKNKDMYDQIENGEGIMIKWNEKHDNLIDRYDGRALLDFIREVPVTKPNLNVKTVKYKDKEERALEEMVKFEGYRDCIRLMSLGLNEQEGLKEAEAENVDFRAAAKVAATVVMGGQFNEFAPLNTASNISSGLISTYGSSAAILDDISTESEIEVDVTDHYQMAKDSKKAALDRDVLDKIGDKQFEIDNFSHKLKKVLIMEGDKDVLRQFKPSKKRLSRKKYAERARRMAGQGLDPRKLDLRNRRDWRDETGRIRLRHSPNFRRYSRSRMRHRSRSKSKTRSLSDSESLSNECTGRQEFITEIKFKDNFGEDKIKQRGGDLGYLETMEEIETRKHEKNRGKREQGRRRSHVKEQDSKYRRNANDKKIKNEINNGMKKETQQERLKRLTLAQINKQAKKDILQDTQKKIQEERDRQARLTIERIGYGECQRRPRSRSRTISPRYRSKSRNRYRRSVSRSRYERSRSRSSYRQR